MNNEPLLNPGWINFCCEYWNIKSEQITLTPSKGNTWELKTIVYRDSKNNIITPPRTPYTPVVFNSTSLAKVSYQRRKRLALTELASFYSSNSIKGALILSSEVNDIRPFSWQKFDLHPLYTYYVDLKNYKDNADKRVLKQSRKADSKGYYIEKTNDFNLVNKCLQASESRKGFSHQISTEGLQRLNELMGPKNFHCYLLKDKEGNAVGARVLLVADKYKVLAWSAGISSSALKDGANHFMIDKLLDLYASEDYKIFDFVGANLPSVAQMKENWGGDLIVYYALRTSNFRNLLIDNYKYARNIINNIKI